ncbi:hypothetical protein HBI56_203450 [Parastagonospora nodorum]|nr:hypothetical protein HBH53_107840 [Parastagonospora nodorum]KAH3970942.1 hypothetical protein HBH52_163660 [Parastagonospora nodorum]KAH3997907.1 hypothetical protein HBI10_138390 [Parastagonospora nodorum]KAH4020369.1 hypothetical protein HBI13_114050 [Parastagonospora nodorum]KAH4065184.1 hypothetical protein HBH50_163110 [Parastagonospora nodorum]
MFPGGLLQSLENLVQEDISLMWRGSLSNILSKEDDEQHEEGRSAYTAHLHGQAWQDFCYKMKQKSPSVQVTLHRVASNFTNNQDKRG